MAGGPMVYRRQRAICSPCALSELDQRPDGLVDLRRGEPVPLPPPRLLGPFDPLLLGWHSRGLVLDQPQEVVTVNGIVKASVLVDGRVAGTWTMSGGQVKLQLWNRQSRATTAELGREASAVEAYLKPPACAERTFLRPGRL